jgi:hypothetical protein
MKNHPFKDIYNKIYTIGYYSAFYSSLKDENCANAGLFEFLSKNEEDRLYLSCMYQMHLHEKQMVIPSNIFETFEIIGYVTMRAVKA